MSEHADFVTIYHPIAGWKPVHYWWNPDMGGFWEPYETFAIAFGTKLEARNVGITWAEQLGLEFKEPTNVE